MIQRAGEAISIICYKNDVDVFFNMLRLQASLCTHHGKFPFNMFKALPLATTKYIIICFKNLDTLISPSPSQYNHLHYRLPHKTIKNNPNSLILA